MNILVTGANGQLGRSLRRASAGSQDHYVFSDVVEVPGLDTHRLDITDAAAVEAFVREHAIEAIVNCAAYTDVEGAETQVELAQRLNASAPGILAAAMARTGGLLVHISTDYVFGGSALNTPCREDLPANPLGVYGRTKREGELAVLSAGCRYLIIRTAWLYSEYGKNFVKTMLRLTAERPSVKVVFDQAGTPTYAGDLAAAVFDILENRKFPDRDGIYHYSNEGVCSWYDFAREIARLAGNEDCTVLPCHSDEFPSRVTRPAYSVLDKTLIKETFGLAVPYWTESLRLCLARMGALAGPKAQPQTFASAAGCAAATLQA